MTETAPRVAVESVSQVIKKLHFEVPWETVKTGLEATYLKLSKKAKLKGFRQGKIPRPILEKYFRPQAEEDTIYEIINKCFSDFIAEQLIEPVTVPNIEQKGITSEESFSFTATVEVPPVIDPVGYIGMNIQKTVRPVEPADIDDALQRLRKSMATFKDTPDARGAAKGDYLIIDYQGYSDGIPLEHLAGSDVPLHLEDNFAIPAFAEQLTGMMREDEKEFSVRLPDDYPDNKYVGTDVLFKVKIKRIMEEVLPEIDDNFVKNYNNVSSLDEFRSRIEKSLAYQFEQQAALKYENDVLDQLLEVNVFDVPPSLVERQTYSIIEDNAKYLMSRGLPKEVAVKQALEGYDSLKPEAIKILKSVYLLNAIQTKESISVDKDKIDSAMISMADARGQHLDDVKNRHNDAKERERLARELINKEVFAYIWKHSLTANNVENEATEQKGEAS